jgi:hypothetical protein
MDIALCVDRLLPAADFALATDYAALVETWQDERTIPTEVELAEVWETIQAEEQGKDALVQARSAMASIFDALPLVSQWKFKPYREGIEGLLDEGEVALAYQGLSEIQTETQEEADAKVQLLALFPN